MATFTIDLLTGNLYLFNGDFNGSGSTPTSGSTYPKVSSFTELPTASSASGKIYVVLNSYGTYVLNRKPSGFYFSTGSEWRFLGDTPDFFKSSNFQVYDNVDTSKGVMFTTSGISTNVFRKLKVQNSDGTIAYLTDLNVKLDISAFNDYTGTTAPATFLSKTAFNTYSGTTVPTNYYNKAQINAYSGATLLLIGDKQDKLTAGQGISIVGNVISATGGSSNISSALQLLDTVGGANVNTIAGTPIVWSSLVFTGTSLSFTGGSRIYIQANGKYEISYVVNVSNDTGSPKNIGTIIKSNGIIDITPFSSSSFSYDNSNDVSTNIMPSYLVSLVAGSYVELVGFRIGNTGDAFMKANGSWIKIKKID